MISIIILLLIIGALLYLLQLVPIDANIKTAIYVIVIVGAAILCHRDRRRGHLGSQAPVRVGAGVMSSPTTNYPVQWPIFQPLSMGCICPPTSEKTCENGLCPRKPIKSVAATS